MTDELNTEPFKIEPPRILIYGAEGIGKSSFGSMADNPVFIQAENGLQGLPHVRKYPIANTFQNVLDNLQDLSEKNHDRKTLVVDCLDRLEALIWIQVCKEHNVKNIEEVMKGFGKGFMVAIDLWDQYIQYLEYLRLERQMTIVQIAHAQIKRYEDPTMEAYDRFTIKLQDGKSCSAAGKLLEYSDIVLFAQTYVGLKTSEPVFNKKRTRGVGGEERFLYTQERPGFRAKNRFGLPFDIEFKEDGKYWEVLKQHIPYFNQQQGEVKNA